MISMKDIVGQDKYCDDIEIHELRDLLIPKIKKSKDPSDHYLINSARRLFVDVLASTEKEGIYRFDKVKEFIRSSTVEELAACVGKPNSQFSKMVSKGDVDRADMIQIYLYGHIACFVAQNSVDPKVAKQICDEGGECLLWGSRHRSCNPTQKWNRLFAIRSY